MFGIIVSYSPSMSASIPAPKRKIWLYAKADWRAIIEEIANSVANNLFISPKGRELFKAMTKMKLSHISPGSPTFDLYERYRTLWTDDDQV